MGLTAALSVFLGMNTFEKYRIPLHRRAFLKIKIYLSTEIHLRKLLFQQRKTDHKEILYEPIFFIWQTAEHRAAVVNPVDLSCRSIKKGRSSKFVARISR